MFTAFAPPAMRYPPIVTSSTESHVGEPAAYIGATVVTSSSEMIRGLVSAIRSRDSGVGGFSGSSATPVTVAGRDTRP